MAKLVYFSREPASKELGGRLNFLKFETDNVEQCLDFINRLKTKQQRLNGSKPGELCVMATGGGAYKYYDRMKEVLGVEVLREDEMECLIIGEAYHRIVSAWSDLDIGKASISSSPKSRMRSSLTATLILCTSPKHEPTYTHTYSLILVLVSR